MNTYPYRGLWVLCCYVDFTFSTAVEHTQAAEGRVYNNQVVLKDSCSLTISWGNCWVQPVSGLQTQARSVQGHAVRRSWESRQRWMRAAWDWTSFKGRSRCVWPWRVAWRLLGVALHWPTLQTRRLDVWSRCSCVLLQRPARYFLPYISLFLCNTSSANSWTLAASWSDIRQFLGWQSYQWL